MRISNICSARRCTYGNFYHIFTFSFGNFCLALLFFFFLEHTHTFNELACHKRAAVLFVLSWLVGFFNGNLNKLLNPNMKLHINIQCQCVARLAFQLNHRSSLPYSRSLVSCMVLYRCGIDREGCWDLEIISNKPGTHLLLCPPACIDRERPCDTAALLATEMSGGRFKVQLRTEFGF